MEQLVPNMGQDKLAKHSPSIHIDGECPAEGLVTPMIVARFES